MSNAAKSGLQALLTPEESVVVLNGHQPLQREMQLLAAGRAGSDV